MSLAKDIAPVVEDLFASLLQLAVQPVAPADAADHLVSSIQISGAWRGSVTLTCPPVLGQKIAATMLSLDETHLCDADILDSLGELVNIISGNIKPCFPTPSQLSLPVAGAPQTQEPTWIVEQLSFLCDGQTFSLLISQEQTQ